MTTNDRSEGLNNPTAQRKGRFVDFYLGYSGKTATQQAEAILDEAQGRIDLGANGVMITYSANYEQTQEIGRVYAEGGWDTGTSGSGQASVIRAMEGLLGSGRSELQQTMRIAPITTMTYQSYGDRTHAEIVTEDIERIRRQLDDGWDVLGWINEDSKPDYAVGGGVASSEDPDKPGEIRFPKPLQEQVQQALRQLAQDYPAD